MILVFILIFMLGVAYINFRPSLDTITIQGNEYLIVWYYDYNNGYYSREYKILFKLKR